MSDLRVFGGRKRRMNFEDRFIKSEQLVAKVLKEFPETRDDDIELIRRVWEKQGFKIPSELLPYLHKVIHPETITRARRKIQADGLYKSSGNVYCQRKLNEIETRNRYR